jgi:hypothetical protein
MSLLDTLEKQPNFPREDLSEINAMYLSLAIANLRLLGNVHTAAEEHYPIFSGTHRPLMMASENIFDNGDVVRAINFGIRALEAMTLFVQANRPTPALEELKSNISNIIKPSNTDAVSNYFVKARDSFIHETPRTADVITESSGRFHPPRLAVLGAAIARQFELDNIQD